jgi:hypothetical protein
MNTPITVHLSKFEQLEILRTEIEAREEQLKQTERQIRQILYEMERQRYLQTLHEIFVQLPPPEGAENLEQLNQIRDALGDAILAMQAALKQLEAETAGQSAPPPRPGMLKQMAAQPPSGANLGAPRRKFDF